MNNEAGDFLMNLLKEDPKRVQSWVKSVLEEREQAPVNFNWLGLAEVAASRAGNEAFKPHKDPQVSLTWAQVAISVYEFLAAKRSKDSIQDSLLSSLMNLRANMILQFGVKINDPVLDSEPILNCFFENLVFSYEEGKAKAFIWKKLFSEQRYEEIHKKLEVDMEEILILRETKSRLNIIKRLLKNGLIESNTLMENWISIWEILP